MSSSSAGKRPLKMLVIDGYAAEGRKDLVAGGCQTAGDLYAGMLDRNSPVGAESTIVYPCDDDFVKPDWTQYDGVAWTGCSLTVYSEEKRVEDQIDLCREVYEVGTPQFGSCWAQQIAAVAAGGKCAENPHGREMWLSRKMTLTSDGRAHPMFEGKEVTFDAFTSHTDEITHMPKGAQILCSNAHTNIQAVSINHLNGTFWGLQYHPEYDLHEIGRLIFCRKEKLIKCGYFVDGDDVDAFVEKIEALHQDNKSSHLRWQLGVDDDVIDGRIRCIEVANWIAKQVMPFAAIRE